MRWKEDAKVRLAKAPFFVRPFIKKRAEAAAREQGLSEVTVELLAALKQTQHPGA